MRTMLFTLLCGFALSPLGCGSGGPEPGNDQELTKMQDRDQQQADEAERQMIRQKAKAK